MKVILIVVANFALIFAEYPSYLPPSSNHGTPDVQQPTNLYGAPNFQSQTTSFIKPNVENGASGGRYHGSYQGHSATDNDNFEPANYNFEYHLYEPQHGNEFGHQEARQGDVAQGKYFVLLPDGRKQIIEYVADENGYNPKVSYEGTVTTGIGIGYNNEGYPTALGSSGSHNGGGYSAGGYQNPGSHYGDDKVYQDRGLHNARSYQNTNGYYGQDGRFSVQKEPGRYEGEGSAGYQNGYNAFTTYNTGDIHTSGGHDGNYEGYSNEKRYGGYENENSSNMGNRQKGVGHYTS